MNTEPESYGNSGWNCKTCNLKFRSKTGLLQHTNKYENELHFKCRSCRRTFQTIQSVTKHQNMKHRSLRKQEYFKCRYCLRKFKHKHYLESHKIVHKKPFLCKLCWKHFENQSDFNFHNNVVHKIVIECRKCPENLISSTSFNKHLKLSHGLGVKSFICEKCAVVFSSKLELDLHIQTHIKNQCRLCLKKFNSKTAMKRHTKEVHPQDLLDCPFCLKKFPTTLHLDDHMDKIHKKQCNICEMLFADSKSLSIHRTEDHAFKCELCRHMTFNNLKSLKSHRNEAHPFKCGYCRIMRFSSVETLEDHQEKVHPAKVLLTECEICHLRVRNAEALSKHKDNAHANLTITVPKVSTNIKSEYSPMIKCFCSQQFENKPEFRQHILTHGLFNCEFCDLSFRKTTSLGEHLTIVHPNIISYRCGQCNEGLNSVMEFVKHCDGCKKQFKFEQCPETYSTEIELHSHSIIHNTDEFPFKCTLCSQVFANELYLNRHFQHHGLQKCEKCDEMFGNITELHAHAKSHKNFKCDECPTEYTSKKYLKIHKKQHEQEGFLECEICFRCYSNSVDLNNHVKMKHSNTSADNRNRSVI